MCACSGRGALTQRPLDLPRCPCHTAALGPDRDICPGAPVRQGHTAPVRQAQEHGRCPCTCLSARLLSLVLVRRPCSSTSAGSQKARTPDSKALMIHSSAHSGLPCVRVPWRRCAAHAGEHGTPAISHGQPPTFSCGLGCCSCSGTPDLILLSLRLSRCSCSGPGCGAQPVYENMSRQPERHLTCLGVPALALVLVRSPCTRT